jgi:hypothetical protein
VRFLSELGRPGPYALTHVPVARRWEVLDPAPASLVALDDALLGKALREDARLAWVPAYSLVSGDLPLGEGRGAVVARCRVDVSRAGKVALVLKGAKALKLWVDGSPVATEALELSRGPHVVDVLVDRGTKLRCELAVPAGSSAQAAFVAGK